MPYRFVDIETTQPLPALMLKGSETGVAVCVRYKGRPVDYWMEALPGGSELNPDDLARQISARAGRRLLSASIRKELGGLVKPAPLPSLTIAICTRDRPEQLARCLRSLHGLQPPARGSLAAMEVLVVDNAPSDDRTRDLVAAQPGVRYTSEPRPGLDWARNHALDEASGELLAFLDDDVTVDPLWLDGLLEAWAENPDAAAFTGLVLPYELATEAQILFERRGGFRRGFEKIRYQGQQWPGNPLYPCGAGMFGAGANMTFRRDVIRELGGFDEALDTGSSLPGGGDLDMFYRVIRAGYPLVYEPSCMVFHQHRREIKALRRQYWSWGLGFMTFVTKTFQTDPERRGRLARLVLWWFKDQARQLAKSLAGRHVLSPRMIWAELRGGIAGLCGMYRRSKKRAAQIQAHYTDALLSPRSIPHHTE